MPTLTIDDKQITVPNGTGVIPAARMAGVEIPVFCYHSRMASVGMCRMCLVKMATPKMGPDRKPVLKPDGTPEMQWNPKLQTACTLIASEGMLIDATSQEVQDARRGVVEFLLTSHPLDCPICDKGGECPLQEQTLTYGPGASRFVYNDKFVNEKHVPLGPLIVLDRERCVQCARCIRFQDEIADDHVLGFSDRGRGMEIITHSDPPFNSKFSGNTTDICPVGALTTTDFRFQARPWELKYIPTVCPHCAVGCNMTLSVRNNADIKRILPRTNASVNDIWICDKGRFGHHFADDSQKRLTTPLIRKDGDLVEASWAEALALVAEKFGQAKAKDPHSIAGLAGDRAPNEDLYLFNKFFQEVLGSNNVSSTLDADDLNATVGLAANSDITKLGKGNVICVIGADVEEEAPVAFLRIKQAKELGASLIVANGRTTKLDRYATTLRYRYGTEGQLLAAWLHVIINEDLANIFVAARTNGFETLKDSVHEYDPDSVAGRTGLSADAIRDAARTFAQAKDVVFVYGRELAEPAAREMLKTLALITGHVGRANNGVWPILEHNNTQGARELLPPYAERQANVWYIMGAEMARADAEFVVVQDMFLTKTALSADVVLPVQSFAERDGTYINYERRVQHFTPAIRPIGDSKTDWQILRELANELDHNWKYTQAAEVFAELAEKVPALKGMSYAKLAGRQFRSRPHFLYEGTSFETQGGQGMVYASAAEHSETKFDLKFSVPTAPPSDGLQLIAPRVLYDAGTLISETELLHQVTPIAYADLNRADAERLQIKDGDRVRLKSAHGEAELLARVDGRAPAGVVVAPMNLGPMDTRILLKRGEVVTTVTLEKV